MLFRSAAVSTLRDLKPYDVLFVLSEEGVTWSQEAAGTPPESVSLAQGWNSVCYSGVATYMDEAVKGISGDFTVAYTLSPTQAWYRFVPGQAELSDFPVVVPGKAVLILVPGAEGAQWVFNP